MKKTLKQIKVKISKLLLRLKAYIKRLLFPLYLFPVKLITYSLYYFLKFILKLLFAIIGLIFDCIKFPFKSLKNFLKSIVLVLVFLYLLASLFVIMDYLTKQYGYFGKFLCSFGTQEKLIYSVVRVVGGYSEGTGFFIAENQIITNFHVIDGEPSPKVILQDGTFFTPEKIIGDKNSDLAILYINGTFPSYVFPLPDRININLNEPVIAVGYPLGTDLVGRATAVKGRLIDFRQSKSMPTAYAQTDISLVEGMSGGPLTDQCGQVIGINTMSLSGMSMSINAEWANAMIPYFTDQEIKKISVDPSKSPEEAVKAFYTYLKARRMEDGFKLLSKEYLKKTNYQEWTNRFKDILDVNVFKSEKFENTKDTVFVKFNTKNWVNNEAEYHYYEGTWQTIKEDGVYKMLKSKILEVENPDSSWFYE